jgi:predicted Zn-dependent protease
MCVALRNDQTATATTLKRLREAEPAPYYSSLTVGIQQLRNGAPDRAESTFSEVVQARQGDPLALYFTGEAQHQLKRNNQAIASFKAVLKRWPEYTPALGAAARLLASPDATAQDLKEAVSMTERATAIEPMNRDYWMQLAELYERTGQRDRAAAVKLQWLSRPVVR